MYEWIAELLIGFASGNPIVASILMVIGILRVTIKPLMSVVHIIVDATATKKDNEAVEKVEASKGWKTFLYIIDWLGSIKLKK